MARFFSLFFLAISAFACNSPAIQTTATIQNITDRFVPDKRIARFDVTARNENSSVVLTGTTSSSDAKDSLLEELNKQGISYVDSIIVWPHPDLGKKTYGLVRHSVANIRSEPKHSSELATQALLGTPLRVFQKQDGWYMVQTPDGYISWLDSGGLSLLTASEYEAWKQADRVFIITNASSYENADLQDKPVGDLVVGNILVRENTSGTTSQIRYPDGRLAFVDSSHLISFQEWATQASLSPKLFSKTAHQLTGRPYLWGGTSNKGMDCSGFTKMVYWLHGHIIPRDASQQVHAGIAVPLDEELSQLLPGDFLFFGRYRDDGSEKITHVGIYLGMGQFIHSGADNGAIRVENLLPETPNYAPHRRESLLRAKRLSSNTEAVINVLEHDWY